MIERMNLRTGISTSLLRSKPASIAEIPQRFSVRSHHATSPSSIPASSVPQPIEKNRQRWYVDAKLLKIEPPARTLEPAFNPHQWLLSGNPRLANLVTETIGDRWMTHLEDLQQLAPLASDPLFQSRWQAVKQANKHVLANNLYRTQGIRVNTNSLFDLQLQPIVGHQRQLLNILQIVSLFHRLKQNPDLDIVPRTFIFGDPIVATEPSATAPSDEEDRSIAADRAVIELIQSLARTIAADPDVNHKLQVVYVPASAALMNQMYAAADVTEQIATAAIEDVDLSKLKATINGVISIGSLGKTNYWLQQTVGEENCFLFGLAIPEIALFAEYGYDPYNYYKHYPQIRQAIDSLLSGYFTPEDPSICRSIIDSLLGTDEHMVLADYIFYAACQSHVSETYRQTALWTQMSILNVAGVR
jgi:glycogen phosphorylase